MKRIDIPADERRKLTALAQSKPESWGAHAPGRALTKWRRRGSWELRGRLVIPGSHGGRTRTSHAKMPEKGTGGAHQLDVPQGRRTEVNRAQGSSSRAAGDAARTAAAYGSSSTSIRSTPRADDPDDAPTQGRPARECSVRPGTSADKGRLTRSCQAIWPGPRRRMPPGALAREIAPSSRRAGADAESRRSKGSAGRG